MSESICEDSNFVFMLVLLVRSVLELCLNRKMGSDGLTVTVKGKCLTKLCSKFSSATFFFFCNAACIMICTHEFKN